MTELYVDRTFLDRSTCSVDGCRKKTTRKDTLCGMHYIRFMKTGTTDPRKKRSKKAVSDFLESLLGNNTDDCIAWPFPSGSRYGTISVDGKSWPANRYVCVLKHGHPVDTKLQAAHSCGNGHKGCVNPNHLRWATPLENSHDKVGHGTQVRGETSPASKLTDKKVKMIRLSEKSDGELARLLGVSRCTIRSAKAGATWAHVT